MKEWAELPVSAHIKRMRAALAAVLPQWGLGAADLRFIFHGENTTFRAFTKRGSFLIRVARPGYHTPRETLSEMTWLEALHAETGLCPQPVRTRDGEFVVPLDQPDVFASHVCVFKWMDGTIVGRRLSNSTLIETGELTARFHQHAAGWKPPHKLDRPGWEIISGKQRTEENQLAWRLLPAEHRRFFGTVERDALHAYETLSHRRDIGLLHLDLHARNVLRTPRGLAAIDFDDCGFAPWVVDLAVSAAYWNTKQTERMQSLLHGYHQVREFPAHQLKYLPVLIAWRCAGVCLWVTARAESNAMFRARLKPIQDNLLKTARSALTRSYT